MPTFSGASILAIMPAIIATILKFLGDSHACAKVIGYPAPPIHALNRGKFTLKLIMKNNKPKSFRRACFQGNSISSRNHFHCTIRR